MEGIESLEDASKSSTLTNGNTGSSGALRLLIGTARFSGESGNVSGYLGSSCVMRPLYTIPW
jgi:hypothetical protein